MHHCFKCDRMLDDSSFNNNAARPSGLSDECRECKSLIGKKYRATEEYRIAHMERSRKNRHRYRESARLVERRRRLDPNNAVKIAARTAVRRAIEAGRIHKPSRCSVCCVADPRRIDGVSALHAHHHAGYDHPLDIVWVCERCHRIQDGRARGAK